MQGLADGYFILPYTVGDYLAAEKLPKVETSHQAFREVENEVRCNVKRLLDVKGTRSVDSFHRELGKLIWEYCGMARNAQGLQFALEKIPEMRDRYWHDVRVTGGDGDLNSELEKAGRVADFFELAELMCIDALHRNESCGGHFREEYQTPDGEALRNDDQYSYAAAWEFRGVGNAPLLHKEPLVFDYVHPTQRSYK
jgi:succinate dehydrogenase / fumarate reductase flavoprotein subunit